MILLIDIGNSNTKFKLSDSDVVFEIQTSTSYTSANIEAIMPKAFLTSIEGAVISSVVPKASIAVVQYVRSQYNVKPLLINTDNKTNVIYPTLVHNELGTDIMCSVEGALAFDDTYLTIDCGTANTFNLVIDKEFIGCAISPGVYTSHRALMQQAGLIHYVDLNGPIKLIALSTDQCVRSGVIYGFAFMIEGFIQKIKEQYRLPNLKVYLTGGMSTIVYPMLKETVILSPNLVFEGMERIYYLNQE